MLCDTDFTQGRDGVEYRRWKIRRFKRNGEVHIAISGAMTHRWIKVMSVDEHETIVARSNVEITRLRAIEDDRSIRKFNKVYGPIADKIAIQAEVIEKLKLALNILDDDIALVSQRMIIKKAFDEIEAIEKRKK